MGSSSVKRGGVRTPPSGLERSQSERRFSVLIDKHEIITIPSASALSALRNVRSRREPAQGSVAIFADPVFDGKDDRVRLAGEAVSHGPPAEGSASFDNVAGMALTRSAKEVGLTRGEGFRRLPFSLEEAESIYSMANGKGAMKALGFRANKPTALSAEMKQYRIIHFATHGILNSEHPELSGLVLSLVDARGAPQNGFVRLFDIYNMDLNAELVVLSGCQTGLGKQMRGEGLIGLTRGFMYAGAARVIASLWRVDDAATAELMKKFYEGVLTRGEQPAPALRRAQTWMRRQKLWSSPYYWAGFVLQGDWK